MRATVPLLTASSQTSVLVSAIAKSPVAYVRRASNKQLSSSARSYLALLLTCVTESFQYWVIPPDS